MTRMPMVGDSVRRVVDGKVLFEGYIVAAAVFESAAEPPTVDLMGVWSAAEARVRPVPTYHLIRGQNGWSWAPFDAKPGVGDIVSGPEALRPLTAHHEYLLEHVSPTTGEWRVSMRSAYPGDPLGMWQGACRLDATAYAKAVAGLDGWSWQPARWSGVAAEVKAAP